MTRYLLLLVAAFMLVGCASKSTNPDDFSDVSAKSINKHLTPELLTLDERGVDSSRHLATMKNTNWRMFWQDWSRAFYADHPSRLSPYPVLSTSGQPR